jgi:ATP synthase subunit 8
MPQLDKVTLFSQVFWLIFLYFLFFLIILRYYLPKFSKLFKLRSYYINSSNGVSKTQTSNTHSISQLFLMFNSFVAKELMFNKTYYKELMRTYNSIFLEKANIQYVLAYTHSYLKFKLYKKLYL